MRAFIDRPLGKRIALLVSLCVLSSLLQLTQAQEARAAFPGGNGRLVRVDVTAGRTGKLYALQSDGTQAVQLTSTTVWQAPSFSPDGSKIVAVNTGSATTTVRAGTLYTMSATGSQQTAVTTSGEWASPSWSPDGSKIVAIKTTSSGVPAGKLYTMNADGTGQVQLGSGFLWETPAFSSDGSTIAAVKVTSDTKLSGQLFSVASNGAQETALTISGTWASPSWAPDGSKLLAVKTSSGTYATGELYSVSPTGAQQTQLASGYVWQSPSYSPDGTKIAATKLVSQGDLAGSLYTMTATGASQTQVGTGTAFASPAWQALPKPTITSPPPDVTANPVSSWSFTGGSGNTFECKLERASTVVLDWASCTSPKAYNLTGYPDGDHIFSVRQKDSYGNVSASATDGFTLNRLVVPPTIQARPDDPTDDATPTWAFTGTPGNTIECELKRSLFTVQGWTPCTSPKTYDLTSQSDGIYTLRLRQKDAYGNLSNPVIDTFDLDRSVLAPIIDSRPNDTTGDSNPAWSFSTSQGSSFECKLERGAATVQDYAACTSPKSFDLGAEVDGAYTFSVRARSASGNLSASTSDGFMLDRIVAAPSITSAPADITRRAQVSWDLSGSTGKTLECRLDVAGAVVFDYATCTSPASYDVSAESDATYTFSARQRDQWGNVSPAVTDSFTLDRYVADPPITSGPSDTTHESHPSWTFESASGLSSECTLLLGEVVVVPFGTCASPVSFDLSSEPDGAYTFKVRNKDAEGNISAGATDDFILDRFVPAPTIDSGPDDPSKDSHPKWVFIGSPGNAFECRLERGEYLVADYAPCSSHHGYDLSQEIDGRYTLSVREVDGSGNHSEPATDDFSLDRFVTAPSITSSPEDTTANFRPTWTFTGSEGTSLECMLERAETVIHVYEDCSATKSYDLVSQLDVTYTFSVRAEDSFGNLSSAATDDFTLERPPGVTLTVDQWEVDELSGEVTYDVTMNATGTDISAQAPCSSDCGWRVEAVYKDGSTTILAKAWYGRAYYGAPSIIERYTGTDEVSGEITDLRAIVHPSSDLNSPARYETPDVHVHDHYSSGYVDVDIDEWAVDEYGNADYSIGESFGGANKVGGACEAFCKGHLEVKYDTGEIAQLDSGNVIWWHPWEGTESFEAQGKYVGSGVVAVRGVVYSYDQSAEKLIGPWEEVSDFMLADIDVSGLASILTNTGVNLAELCVVVEERARVLRIPDATVSTETHATTEACLGAESVTGALIALAAVLGGPAVIGAIIHHYDDGPNADSITKVPQPETDASGSGVRPPTGCLSKEQKDALMEDLADGNWVQDHHAASNKNSYWTQLFKDLLARPENAYAADESLSGGWNIIEDLLHRGTHPPAYHFWVYRNLEKALRESSTWDEFLGKWNDWVKRVIRDDPTIIRWEWWRC